MSYNTIPATATYRSQTEPQRTTADRSDQFGKDTFLKLLVAQLRFQNPLAPKDGSEFLAQTAQFTMVEKLESLSKETAELAAAGRSQSATAMLGRSVTYRDDSGTSRTGVVTSARFTIDGPLLRVGSHEVPLANVEEVAPTS